MRGWTAEHDGDLNELERRYLDLSVAHDQREQNAVRRRTRRLTRPLADVTTFSVVAVSSAFYAFVERGNANRQRDLAVSCEPAITADQLRATDVPLAAQLALAAYHIAPTPQARSSLLQAYAGPAVTRLVGPTSVVQAAATSLDGQTRDSRDYKVAADGGEGGAVGAEGRPPDPSGVVSDETAHLLGVAGTDRRRRGRTVVQLLPQPAHPWVLWQPIAADILIREVGELGESFP